MRRSTQIISHPRIPSLCLTLFTVASGHAITALAAPQTFDTALPVGQGEFIFREQFLYIKASQDPSAADRRLEVLGAISALGYGVTGDLALFAVVPYLDKELELSTPDGRRRTRDTNGIGDARLFARYPVFRMDLPGRNFRIAPFLGLELPTGDDDGSDSFGRLPPPLRSGSGSWDPFGGAIATYQTLDYELDAQLSYQVNTEATGFAFGDELRFDASFQYRLWPRQLGSGVPGFLYGGVEANFLHQARNHARGTADPDSGGEQLFLAPALQYATRRWVFEGTVQLPVFQRRNGTALEDDFVVRAGFRVNF